MDQQLAAAQALKYAEELRELHEIERAHRRGVEEALRRLEESYGTTVRALATALELRDDATGEHADRVTCVALRLAARIFALADAFDAMTNDRPYRRALSPAAALGEIAREAGRQFDPVLAAQFVALLAAEEAA